VTAGPTVFATVGTDHHPFDRLVDWMDRWLEANVGRAVTGVIQTGTSAPPQVARSAPYLGHAEMEAAVADAVAVVTHGGPGSIMLCCYMGKKPIVVPRRSDLGEHVDDHQVLFSRRLAAEGRIDLAEGEEGFSALLDRALERGGCAASPEDVRHVAEAVRRFEGLVDDLLGRPAGRDGRSRRRFVRRSGAGASPGDLAHGARVHRGA
jgi:UDP-N-acetylglucosamine transferase subunit ALG13